jgi:hypothetical protein
MFDQNWADRTDFGAHGYGPAYVAHGYDHANVAHGYDHANARVPIQQPFFLTFCSSRQHEP